MIANNARTGFVENITSVVGRYNVVRIRTFYRLDGPGIESWWGGDFPHPSKPTQVPTQDPIQCVPGLFPGVKQPEHGAYHPPLLAPRLKKEHSYDLLPLWGFVVCSRVKFAFLYHICFSFDTNVTVYTDCSVLKLRCETVNNLKLLDLPQH